MRQGVPGFQQFGLHLDQAAPDLDSGSKLARMKRLGQVVVGAGIKPGDDVTALYKAAAIEIGLHPPPEIKAASANRTKGARGWLFRIVRYTDSDVHHLEQITYINSSMYAVST